MSETNQEKQLRLAVGQVLRYAYLLSAGSRPVRSFIAVELEPRDQSWLEFTAELGITLMSPETFRSRIVSEG